MGILSEKFSKLHRRLVLYYLVSIKFDNYQHYSSSLLFKLLVLYIKYNY